MIALTVARVAVAAATYVIDKPYDYLIPDSLIDNIHVGVRVMVNFGRGSRRVEGLVVGLCCDSELKELKPILSVLDETPVLDDKGIRLALWLREQCFCSFYDALKAMLPSGLWYKFETKYILSKQAVKEEACATLEGQSGGDSLVEYLFMSSVPHNRDDIIRDMHSGNTQKLLDILTERGIINLLNHAVRGVSDKTVRLVRLAVSSEDAEEYAARKSKTAPLQRDVVRLLINIGSSTVKEICYFTGASTATCNTLYKNGVVEFSETEVYRRPKLKKGSKREEIFLNEKQNKAYNELKIILEKRQPACALLHGVTGSGKTLVYLKLIENALDSGRTALMLVPEIALTPQLMERVHNYFGDNIAILHSALSVGERYDEWKRIRCGDAKVVIGTRSAIFAPLKNIGIIILDEEQEHTYKSSSNPRYHARNVAKFRCVADSALLLLGSATPSIESMYQAKSGKYSLHTITQRYNENELPEVIIADMREELREGSTAGIGRILKAELDRNLEKGEQSILFLNRRGASRYVVCQECGDVPECPRCSAALTFHSANQRLMCHHCGFSKKMTDDCGICGGKMRYIGSGTQKIEEELHALYPDIEIIRMDTDTTSMKASHEKLLSKFYKERIPIMIGTQMITKGLDFENVTLVGVLSADQSIYTDDYRAAENTFSLITQVVGRAGRGEKKGRAVIQTLSPNNAVIQFAAMQDFESFYNSEIYLRQTRGFPPFSDIISIVISGMSENESLKGCLRVMGKLKCALGKEYSNINPKIFGPAPASLVRVNNKYRYKLSICAPNTKQLRQLVSRLIRDFKSDRQNRLLTITADINSTDF